jgi:ADP-ribosylglycohydrolase
MPIEDKVTRKLRAILSANVKGYSFLMYSIKLCGDVDTIAAIVGAIEGAARGMDVLPKARLERLEQCGHLKTLG